MFTDKASGKDTQRPELERLFAFRVQGWTSTRFRAWLGHVWVDTSNVEAEIDLEMRATALACGEKRETKRRKC